MSFTDGLTEEEIIEWMTVYLAKRGYRVLPPLAGRIRITSYDPVTSEMTDVRYVDPRPTL